MEPSSDDYINIFLLDLKWSEGFECRKCKHKKCIPGRKPFTVKCSNSKCAYVESAIAHTAFDGQHMPLEKQFGILLTLQEQYLKYREDQWQNLLSNVIRKNKQNSREGKPLIEIFPEGHHADVTDSFYNKYFTSELVARLSTEHLSKEFQVQKKTVGKFLQKVGKWMPIEYQDFAYAEERWFHGLKTEQSKSIYNGIYNLLIDTTRYVDRPRSASEILTMMVYSEVYPD